MKVHVHKLQDYDLHIINTMPSRNTFIGILNHNCCLAIVLMHMEYGSQLWPFYDKSVKSFYVAWRRTKGVFKGGGFRGFKPPPKFSDFF